MLTDKELAARCAAVRRKNSWPIWVLPGEINTDYIEGMDLDGSPNANRKNAFDDLHIIWKMVNGEPTLLFKALATTQPGARYTLRPINEEGAAIAALGYHKVWQTGYHRGNYPALIQTGAEIEVWRDNAHNYTRGQVDRAGNPRLRKGWFGINQHHGGNADRSDIGGHSAGCLVTKDEADHVRAMAIKKTDPRFEENRQYVFDACIMTAGQVLDAHSETPGHVSRPRPSITPDAPKGLWVGVFGGVTTLGAAAMTFAQSHPFLLTIVAAATLALTIAYFSRAPYKENDPHVD